MSERRGKYNVGGVKVSEHAEQVAVIGYCRARGWLTFAIPNGAHLAAGVRGWRRLESEGALPGIPDLFHPYPRGGYHGLFIEMKAGSNKPTPAQAEMLEALAALGYRAIYYRGADEAIAAIDAYMAGG